MLLKRIYFFLMLLNALIFCLSSDYAIRNKTTVDPSEFNALMQKLKFCVAITTNSTCLTRNAVSGYVNTSPECQCTNVTGPTEALITCKIDKEDHKIHVFMKGNITVFECKPETVFPSTGTYIALGIVGVLLVISLLVVKYSALSHALGQFFDLENIEMGSVQEDQEGAGVSCSKEDLDDDRAEHESQTEDGNFMETAV